MSFLESLPQIAHHQQNLCVREVVYYSLINTLEIPQVSQFGVASQDEASQMAQSSVTGPLAAGAHPRGAVARDPPWEHYIFRVSSVKLRDLHLVSLFLQLFAMWED